MLIPNYELPKDYSTPEGYQKWKVEANGEVYWYLVPLEAFNDLKNTSKLHKCILVNTKGIEAGSEMFNIVQLRIYMED